MTGETTDIAATITISFETRFMKPPVLSSCLGNDSPSQHHCRPRPFPHSAAAV
jgi:hypothetical protein